MVTGSFHKNNSYYPLLILVLLLVGFVLLLITVPFWVPIPQDVSSAAAVENYNNGAAYFLAVSWAAFSTLLLILLNWLYPFAPDRVSNAQDPFEQVFCKLGKREFAELVIVFGGVFLIYFPFALARYGPFSEDLVFLNALHRMFHGQRPFVDFEYLYGPLMLYLPHYWIQATGYSMKSYYFFLALLEAIQYVLLLLVLQKFTANKYLRYTVFLVVSVFLFNVLLAPNQNGFRKLLPALVLLLLVSKPLDWRRVTVAAILVGVQLSYSYEYGVAVLLAIVGIYGLLFLQQRRKRLLLLGAVFTAEAIMAWLILSFMLMGGDFLTYLSETQHLISRFSIGEAGFRFYWTGNSIALFGLLSVALTLLGFGFKKAVTGEKVLTTGDLAIFGSVVYALVALRSGLNRADLWHLNPAFIPLIVVLLLPLKRNCFGGLKNLNRAAFLFIGIAAATYVFGQLPNGSYYANGLYLGMRDIVLQSERHGESAAVTRTVAIETERSNPRPEILRLGAFLASPENKEKPVFYYGDSWYLGVNVGVVKSDFINDDFLYSDNLGYEVKSKIRNSNDAIVIMTDVAYRRLYATSGEQKPEIMNKFPPSIIKSLGSYLSTIHYHGAEIEERVKEERWTRTVGEYLRDNYTMVHKFGSWVVLEENENG